MKNNSTKSSRDRFTALIKPLLPNLSRFARAVSSDTEEAKDLVSETLLQAYERFESLKNEKAFLSYLFTITKRLASKRDRRMKFHSSYDQNVALSQVDTAALPDRSTDAVFLYSAIEQLPTKQAEALVLFEITDLSLVEVAKIQGVTLSGVKSRVRRARAQLEKILQVDRTENRAANHNDDVEPSNVIYINAA